MKVDAEIKNVGDTEITEVDWDITLNGGLILLGIEESGTLSSIAASGSEIVSDKPVFGFGKVQILVVAEAPNVSPITKTVDAFVFLVFVRVLQ
jgi:hypothetical protein